MPTLPASAIAGYAKNAGVTGQNIVIATAIALAESGGNSDAMSPPNTNGTTDYGLWQINSVHQDLLSGKDWRDPAQNAQMMFTISNGGTNWRPWSTFNNGAYLAHLGQANGVVPDTSVGPGGVQPVSLASDFTALQNFAHVISDPHTWLRLGMIVGGSIMLLIAVHKSVDVHVPAIAKLATKVAV